MMPDDFGLIGAGLLFSLKDECEMQHARADRAEAALAEALQKIPRWQPIETAPKTRDPILVCSTFRAHRLSRAVVFWREELNEWYTLDLQPYPGATHWMYLPLVPES